MKRVLAMILTAVFCMINNVDFQMNSDVPFIEENYFKVEEGRAPDYRYVTQNYNNLSTSGNCLRSSVYLSKARLYRVDMQHPEKAWFDLSTAEVNAEVVGSYSSTNEYQFSGITDIVCPQKCTIKSDSASSDGHSMELETTDGKYIIYITDMSRWFCCRNRKLEPGMSDMDQVWAHTVNLTGTTLGRGDMIGVANSNTKISFYLNNDNKDPVTISMFYTQ